MIIALIVGDFLVGEFSARDWIHNHLFCCCFVRCLATSEQQNVHTKNLYLLRLVSSKGFYLIHIILKDSEGFIRIQITASDKLHNLHEWIPGRINTNCMTFLCGMYLLLLSNWRKNVILALHFKNNRNLKW